MFGMTVRIGTRVPRNLLAANGLRGFSTLSGTHHGVDFPDFDRSVCSLNVLDRHLELFCCIRDVPDLTVLVIAEPFISLHVPGHSHVVLEVDGDVEVILPVSVLPSADHHHGHHLLPLHKLLLLLGAPTHDLRPVARILTNRPLMPFIVMVVGFLS